MGRPHVQRAPIFPTRSAVWRTPELTCAGKIPEAGGRKLVFRHICWHILWFSIWHIFWHFIWHSIWHFWAFYLASYLTISDILIYCLTFYLACYQTFYLAISVAYIHVNGRHVNTTCFSLHCVFCTKTALQTLGCRLNSCRQTTNTCQPQNDPVLLLPLITWVFWL